MTRLENLLELQQQQHRFSSRSWSYSSQNHSSCPRFLETTFKGQLTRLVTKYLFSPRHGLTRIFVFTNTFIVKVKRTRSALDSQPREILLPNCRELLWMKLAPWFPGSAIFPHLTAFQLSTSLFWANLLMASPSHPQVTFYSRKLRVRIGCNTSDSRYHG